MTKLQNQLNLSDSAIWALLDEWGFEGYFTLEEVIEDREELESWGFNIDGFIKELGLEID